MQYIFHPKYGATHNRPEINLVLRQYTLANIQYITGYDYCLNEGE